jgi:hypothetical protein
MSNQTRHPWWCDRKRCSAGRASSPYSTHRSSQYHGTFEPETGSRIDIHICKQAFRGPYLLLEFANDCCEGHEITPAQAKELFEALGEHLRLLRVPFRLVQGLANEE